jgi:hypothetical protein
LIVVSCVLGSDEKGHSGVIVVKSQLCEKPSRVQTCVRILEEL